MRRYSIFLLVIFALVFALVAAGCGDDGAVSKLSPLGETSGQAEQTSGGDAPTPSEIMAMMTANAETMTSQTGTFELVLDLDVDQSAMSGPEADFFKDPWKLSGSMAFDTAAQAADATLDLTLMGQTMNLGIKTLDKQLWMSLGGQWYEAPPDMMEGMGAVDTMGGDEGLDAMLAQLQQLMTEVSIDPISWLKNQDPVKVETIDGAKVYHLSGSDPDWAKMLTDVMGIMQSPTFMSMMGEASDLSGMDAEMPTAEELKQIQDVMAAIMKEFKIELWVQQDSSQLRKAAVKLRMVPPSADDLAMLDAAGMSDMDFEGLKSMELSATINLSPNQQVNVKAPSSARSFDDLQADIMQNPSMLGPFGTLLMGGGMMEDDW